MKWIIGIIAGVAIGFGYWYLSDVIQERAPLRLPRSIARYTAD